METKTQILLVSLYKNEIDSSKIGWVRIESVLKVILE